MGYLLSLWPKKSINYLTSALFISVLGLVNIIFSYETSSYEIYSKFTLSKLEGCKYLNLKQ